MIGELTSRQIISFADQGAGAAEIAQTLQIEEAEVRMVLSTNNAGAAEDRDITNEQLAILRNKAYSLAVGAEDESVSAKMTMFLLERDKPSKKEATTNPFVLINQAIIGGNKQFEKLLADYSAPKVNNNTDASS